MPKSGPLPKPTPHRGPTPPAHHGDAVKLGVSVAVLFLVLGGVIILIVAGRLGPAIAIATVSAASYLAVEIARHILGLPPTRMTKAFKAGFGALLSPTPTDGTQADTTAELEPDTAAEPDVESLPELTEIVGDGRPA
jgi:hypothetical protein